jgi:hypothetical protein
MGFNDHQGKLFKTLTYNIPWVNFRAYLGWLLKPMAQNHHYLFFFSYCNIVCKNIWCSVVQPCRHSPHVATGRFSRNGFIIKILTKLLFNSIFLHIVATAKTFSPQKWRMWRLGSFWLDNADLA